MSLTPWTPRVAPAPVVTSADAISPAVIEERAALAEPRLLTGIPRIDIHFEARETRFVKSLLGQTPDWYIPYSSQIGIKFLFLAETPLLRDGHGERGSQGHGRGQRSEPLEIVFHDLEPDICIENQRTEWAVSNSD